MTLSHLTDFSDRLSPMLVKELRQGLRAKTFIAVFLALQILLGIMLLSASASSSSDQAGNVVSAMIFTFFSIAVLIVQPMRGVAVLSSEIKSNTIDMMVLTRLSAWRIVFGKWVAIVSQSALILVTIIPYLILRYFFGGMNLVGEIVFLSLLFFTSMALTAITVGLSGSSSIIIRALIPLIGTPVLFFSMIAMTYGRGSSNLIDLCSLDSRDSVIAVTIYIFSLAYLGWSALTLGASLIAPAAENHSTLRRLITLLLLLILIPVILYSGIDEGGLLLILFILLVPALILALTESNRLLPISHLSWIKHPGLRGILGLGFNPGLASGIVFSVLISLVTVGIALLHPAITSDTENLIYIHVMIGALLFPAVIQCFLFNGEGQRVSNYLLFLLGSGILASVLGALTGAMSNRGFLWLFVWNPFVIWLMTAHSEFSNSDLLVCIITVDIILMILLLLKALQLIRAHNEIILEAERHT